MRLVSLLSVCATTALCAQSEVLFYKFEGGGAKALNYVSAAPAPGEGAVTNSLVNAPTTNFVAGQFGEALNSGVGSEFNYVSTGWTPAVTGDYSWAMWLRNARGTAGPALAYIAGVPGTGGFRIYTGSSTLLTVGGAGGSTYYRTTANIYQAATAGWTHVAFVVDATALTATYYIDGVPEVPIVLTGAPNITGSDFYIGRASSTSYPSIYEIDEFRFLTRQATPAEITAWSTMNMAGAGEFGQGCDAALAANSLPQLGNVQFGLTVTSPAPGSVGVMTLGFSRTAAGPLSLPLDIGTYLASMSGCMWEVSNDVTQLMVLDGLGGGTLPFPMPASGYDGLVLNAQGLFVGGPRGTMSTNPVGLVLGN